MSGTTHTGVSVIDASNMTKDDIDLLDREMKASGYGECIEIGRKNTAACVLSSHRFVIDTDSRIRLRKKEQEAEKVAAEVVANAEMFVEEKKEKPKTKKQIQADATKASNQAVKDKKKAQIEYEKAIIECAKLRAEVERLAKEKKYRAKMAKQKTAKAEEGK